MTTRDPKGKNPNDIQALAEAILGNGDGGTHCLKEFAGTVIFNDANELDVDVVNDDLRMDLRDYLNPNEKMGAADQISILDGLYEHMGVTLPTTLMRHSQYSALQKTLVANPGKRLLPIPLHAIRGVNLISGHERPQDHSGLVLCQEVGFNFNNVVGNQLGYTYSSTQRAFYRDYYGGLSSYDNFVRDLSLTNQVIEDDKGRVWAFPVIDATVKLTGPGSEEKPVMFKPMDPIRLPDVLAMLRVVQNAAGFGPQVEDKVELSSAIIYRAHIVSGIASERSLARGVVGVTGFGGRLAVGILPSRGGQLPNNFVARDTVNGL
jgi:hypothetical protein